MATDASSVDTYESLIPSVQAIVDALARHRLDDVDRTNEEIVALVEEHSDYSPHVNQVSAVRNNREDIIQRRVQTLANGDNGHVERGNVTAEGEIGLTDLPGETHLSEADTSTENATCGACGETFPTQPKLNGHRAHCAAYGDDYTCADCGRTFGDPNQYQWHGCEPDVETADDASADADAPPADLFHDTADAIGELRLADIDPGYASEVYDVQEKLRGLARMIADQRGAADE